LAIHSILRGEFRCHQRSQHRGLSNVLQAFYGFSSFSCHGFFAGFKANHLVMAETQNTRSQFPGHGDNA
jgi:hypothetical protein